MVKVKKEVIEEMLDHDYDEVTLIMIKIKDKSLLTFTDPEWSLFGIPELLQNGKVDPGPVGIGT